VADVDRGGLRPDRAHDREVTRVIARAASRIDD
jgi:hypothetical protein